MASIADIQYPCALTIEVPFPTPRLASIALKALQVDKELSPLVKRTFSIGQSDEDAVNGDSGGNILRTEYKATTNRMLRVAVNSFMDSLNLVVEVMQELDTDVLATEDTKA
ncbi:Pcc1-domain-containing protein [Daldinia loculata]|uniref:Pcc1-domain-containing protein n=1 Tax=Daldinia loculata TaxID=103429 RepID=UPI0020C4FC7E|nr:Pcc1-domain-containing protein [Daldinia loculata]KAI1643455.1 Pcc1-domain-containing protein [Daldinia loculata]KAI2780687.1 Pcc1-domain-containing protein [Daldinia loculata]